MFRLSEHNARQLSKMQECLAQFQEGRIGLRKLIANLEFLMSALQDFDAEVLEEIRDKWAVLEEVYSAAMALHHGEVSDQGMAAIGDSVGTLREHLRRIISQGTGSAESQA